MAALGRALFAKTNCITVATQPQTDGAHAGLLLCILERMYLWLAKCQFYIGVKKEGSRTCLFVLHTEGVWVFVFVPKHSRAQGDV